MEETCEHASVHWQQGYYQLWANCCMCWNPFSIAGLSRKATPPSVLNTNIGGGGGGGSGDGDGDGDDDDVILAF